MAYLAWAQKTITNFSDQNINSLYNEGFVFGRTGKGEISQTRSLRIDLSKFNLNSENRRVLKKTEDLVLQKYMLPLVLPPLLGEGRGVGYMAYNWQIGKLAKDFYAIKFGKGTFSANKIKELMTNAGKSNFNLLFRYVILSEAKNLSQRRLDPSATPQDDNIVGYCICLETNNILHYCYPFYELKTPPSVPPLIGEGDAISSPYKVDDKGRGSIANLGMGMMLKAIIWAKENNKKYIYLGSYQRPGDIYKLQFEGLEWFDGQTWKNDLAELKRLLNNDHKNIL